MKWPFWIQSIRQWLLEKKGDFQHLLSLNDNDVTEPSCEKIIPTLPV